MPSRFMSRRDMARCSVRRTAAKAGLKCRCRRASSTSTPSLAASWVLDAGIAMRRSTFKEAPPPKPKPPPPRPPRPPPPPPGLRFGTKDQHRDDYVYGDGSISYVVLPQGSDGKSSND